MARSFGSKRLASKSRWIGQTYGLLRITSATDERNTLLRLAGSRATDVALMPPSRPGSQSLGAGRGVDNGSAGRSAE